MLAGTVIGPNVLALLEREGAIVLLGSAGLLYLMFLAGLELRSPERRPTLGDPRDALGGQHDHDRVVAFDARGHGITAPVARSTPTERDARDEAAGAPADA